jgi:hypothetical protein
MASVYESIVSWINPILLELRNEFPHPFTIVDVENMPLPSDYPGIDFQAGGIFSSPNDQTFPQTAGSVRHVDFKSFYLRRPMNEFAQRLQNEAFFERLASKIRERNLDSAMPQDGRSWKSITINAGTYPSMRDEAGRWADYLVSLRLEYTE